MIHDLKAFVREYWPTMLLPGIVIVGMVVIGLVNGWS